VKGREKCRCRDLTPGQGEEGTILIGVLWSLFFLGALAVSINAYVWPQLDLAERLKDRTKMNYWAKAGVQRAIFEIIEEDTTDAYDALNESWSNNEEEFKEVTLGEEGSFSIKYQVGDSEEESRYGLIDEERKININKAPEATLARFFEIVGETASLEASEMAAAVMDWLDEDDEPRENGAESAYYQGLVPGYPCKNKDFEVLEELLLVKGMTQEIFDNIKERLTIHGAGAVNINTADGLVLRSLEMDESLAEKIIPASDLSGLI